MKLPTQMKQRTADHGNSVSEATKQYEVEPSCVFAMHSRAMRWRSTDTLLLVQHSGHVHADQCLLANSRLDVRRHCGPDTTAGETLSGPALHVHCQ
jgi:hypothetical protein